MLPDPFSIQGVDHARVREGGYVDITSNTDQPKTFDVFSNPARTPAATSSYKCVYRIYKNVANPLPGDTKDDICEVSIQVKYPARSFVNSEVLTAISRTVDPWLNATNGAANLTKWLRGER